MQYRQVKPIHAVWRNPFKLRNHQQLGRIATTGVEGAYAVSYGVDEFSLADGKASLAPVVFVKVLSDDGLPPLAVSPVRYQPKPVETIDVEGLGVRSCLLPLSSFACEKPRQPSIYAASSRRFDPLKPTIGKATPLKLKGRQVPDLTEES